MNKLSIPAIITATILLAGIAGYAISTPDAFASGQGKGGDEGKGKGGHGQEGCEKATEASQGKTKNPHCEENNRVECLCVGRGQVNLGICIDESCDAAASTCEEICPERTTPRVLSCGPNEVCE